MTGFKLIHLNMQSLRNKRNELEALCLSSYDVVCLTEHHLVSDEVDCLFFDHYEVCSSFYRTTVSEKGGSMILVNKKIEHISLNDVNALSQKSVCEISSTYLKQLDVFVICIYTTGSKVRTDFFSVIENVLLKIFKKRNCIVCGDFNVHFHLQNDRNKKKLCDLFASYGFYPQVNEPTRGNNLIDNIFINCDHHSHSTSVIEGLSDHRAQVLNMSILDYSKENEVIEFRPFSQANKESFHFRVSQTNWQFITK